MSNILGTMPEPGKRSKKPRARAGDGAALPSRKEQWKKLNPRPKGWVSWSPVAVGVALGLLSPYLRSLLVPYEPWGMRAVFPFVQFIGLPQIGMSDELTRTLPQLMLYLQFPLEGLLTKASLTRGLRLSTAVAQLVFLHFIAALVLWIVALGVSK